MLLLPTLGLFIAADILIPAISLAALTANPTRAWTFRQYIHWPVAKWLIPGSILGALIGAWLFSLLNPFWIQLLLAIFLISTLWQFRFGKRKKSFPMPISGFLPLGMAVAGISGVAGGTGPIQNPFLLNAGLEKEQLIATKAVNSLALQLTKVAGYAAFGAMTPNVWVMGIAIGAGAIAGILLAKKHLFTITDSRFRQYTLMLMPLCGIIMLIKLALS